MYPETASFTSYAPAREPQQKEREKEKNFCIKYRVIGIDPTTVCDCVGRERKKNKIKHTNEVNA